jgi:hypothetical protein
MIIPKIKILDIIATTAIITGVLFGSANSFSASSFPIPLVKDAKKYRRILYFWMSQM